MITSVNVHSNKVCPYFCPLFFEKTSGKRSQSSSNFCAVSSEIGLFFNFTFLCALTLAGEERKSNFDGIGRNLYSSCPPIYSTSKTSFSSPSSFSANATTLPLGI